VPTAIYREQVTIERPITLIADPGAEIRGSDIWTDWQPSGVRWIGPELPELTEHGECKAGAGCQQAEQIHRNGAALRRVAQDPGQGEYAVDDRRRPILGDDPAGAVIEVTVRERWVAVEADDVTIEGFVMRQAAAPAQSGGIDAEDHSRLIVRRNLLTESHGAAVSLREGSDNAIVDNQIVANGQLGIHLSGGDSARVTGNILSGNNTDGFDFGWEAGGLKASHSTGLVIESNEACRNVGPGLWCDSDCRDVTIADNRVHGNAAMGVLYEISSRASIRGNHVWGNGLGFSDWGWGGGIVVSSSGDVEVTRNVVAWNADGIVVISQRRDGAPDTSQIRVADNSIVMGRAPAPAYGLGWLEDWNGSLFASASQNAGSGNAFWFAGGEGRAARFAWSGDVPKLDAFNGTPGDAGGRYLTAAERDRALDAAEIPGSAVAPGKTSPAETAPAGSPR
jgi:parallel beta-helix repeat protein